MKNADFFLADRLEAMDVPGDFGVYVHVPFCVRRCRYCAFVSSVRRSVPGDDFARAVCRQFEMEAWRGSRLSTLYIGGGTPTVLDDRAILEIIGCVLNACGSADEITLEANPEHVTSQRAGNWKTAGVTRVSLGVQSFDDAMLRFLGRGHDEKTAIRAIEMLENAGFDEISVDLIYGAKTCDDGLEIERWRRELLTAASLPVAHLSCYELTLEEKTPLMTAHKRGKSVLCDEDAIVGMMACVGDVTGMKQYEVSNYSRGGYLSKHNVSCWAGVPYLGLGPGAHSFIMDGRAIVRRANLPDVCTWMTEAGARDTPRFPVEFSETLTPRTHLAERLMCAARTRFRWSAKAIADRIGTKVEPFLDGLSRAVDEHLLELRHGMYRTTAKGIRLNNRLDALIFEGT